MNFLDRLLGREPRDDSKRPTASVYASDTRPSEPLTDEQAIERYRYLLRTAPPEAIEQAHAEAFAQLTPEQRRQVLQSLSSDLPPQERTDRDDPQSLARMATRAELRQPGTLERNFGGLGFGGMMGSSMLGTIAGVVVGTAIAGAIFDGNYDQGYQDGAEAASADQGADTADGGDAGGDTGFDAGGDVGGDFGGGDFGGGDFGGGDFGGFGGDF